MCLTLIEQLVRPKEKKNRLKEERAKRLQNWNIITKHSSDNAIVWMSTSQQPADQLICQIFKDFFMQTILITQYLHDIKTWGYENIMKKFWISCCWKLEEKFVSEMSLSIDIYHKNMPFNSIKFTSIIKETSCTSIIFKSFHHTMIGK